MKIFQLFTREDLTVTPAKPAKSVSALSGDPAGEQGRGQQTASSDGAAASAEWDGVERRNSPDRRSKERREQGQENLLDTRTGNDRRHYGRRSTDRPPKGRLFIKV
ncbi:MAG: hypothetical protein P4L87_07000 [Formivibrio sp.]|nr:hypothetical protein [Formivibrio sp.]